VQLESQKMSDGHGGYGNTFAESNLVLMWGGAELNPSGTNTIGAATDHTFTLTSSDGSKFKGFSLRLNRENGFSLRLHGKNGATTSSTTFGANDDLLVQVSNLCTLHFRRDRYINKMLMENLV